MSPEIPLPSDPKFLFDVHEALEACSGSAEPTLRVFYPEPIDQILNVPPSLVFASSFNPPTEAHGAMVSWALEVARSLGLLLLLDTQHADKPLEEAIPEDRCVMMRLRFGSLANVKLGVCSHGRFLDKVRALEGRYPGGGPWAFLVGMDTLERILDPRFYEDPEGELRELFRMAGFVVFERPTHPEAGRTVPRSWWQTSGPCFRATLPEAVAGISSSQVRRLRALGLPVGSMVSSEIALFMEQTGLYQADPSRYADRKRRLQNLFARRGEGRRPFNR